VLGLFYNIHSDGLAPLGQQPPCEWARLAIADLPLVHPGYREDTGTRAREKNLVGGVQVIRLQVFLDDTQVALRREVKDHASGDSLEDTPVAGGTEHTVRD
jgi:hypothetical protein